MDTGNSEPIAGADAAADVRRLEARIGELELNLNRMIEQVRLVSQTMIERAKHDGLRIAVLEASRVVHQLGRAAGFAQKSRTVVFIGRGYFGDNIKYAYLGFRDLAKAEGIRCVFLPFDMEQHLKLKTAGLESLSPIVSDWTAEDAQDLLTASVVVLCDNFHAFSTGSPVPFGLLQGARSIQLWHGIPLKEIGLRHVFAPGGQNLVLTEVLGSSGFFDVLVGPNAAAEHEWRQWFGFKSYAATGNPRTDVFYRDPTPLDLTGVDQILFERVRTAKAGGRPVIIYGPTFRDHVGADWFTTSGVADIALECAKAGYEFLINLHPFEQGAVSEMRQRYPGLTFVDANTDIYPIVKYADVFITDYSSLAFDVLHVNCPLIFYRPDHLDYMAKARSLIPGRESYTPGLSADEPTALRAAIKDAVAAAKNPSKDPYRAARAELLRQLFDQRDGHASKRLNDLILDQMTAALSDAAQTG